MKVRNVFPSIHRLGKILGSSNLISGGKLEEALMCQEFTRKKISEVMVAVGYIKAEQLKDGLRFLNMLISAFMIATLIAMLFFVRALVDFNKATSLNPRYTQASIKSEMANTRIKHSTMAISNGRGAMSWTHKYTRDNRNGVEETIGFKKQGITNSKNGF